MCIRDSRWGIETSLRDLKHTIGATNLHSKKTEWKQVGSIFKFIMFFPVSYTHLAVRTSMSDFREQDWMTNIPLYNIDRIGEYLK